MRIVASSQKIHVYINCNRIRRFIHYCQTFQGVLVMASFSFRISFFLRCIHVVLQYTQCGHICHQSSVQCFIGSMTKSACLPPVLNKDSCLRTQTPHVTRVSVLGRTKALITLRSLPGNHGHPSTCSSSPDL